MLELINDKENKYYNRSHISEAKLRQIIRYFCLDFTASSISELTKISRLTVNKI